MNIKFWFWVGVGVWVVPAIEKIVYAHVVNKRGK